MDRGHALGRRSGQGVCHDGESDQQPFARRTLRFVLNHLGRGARHQSRQGDLRDTGKPGGRRAAGRSGRSGKVVLQRCLGHGLHGSERAVRAEQQAHGLVGRRLYLLLPHLQLRRQPAPQQHAHDRRHGTTLRHGSMEGRLLVIRSSGQELQVGNEGSFYGSHTYLRHRTEVLEPAIYGRYELETGDRHADRNRQRGTDHLHASGTDGQHADRRDDDLRTRH